MQGLKYEGWFPWADGCFHTVIITFQTYSIMCPKWRAWSGGVMRCIKWFCKTNSCGFFNCNFSLLPTIRLPLLSFSAWVISELSSFSCFCLIFTHIFWKTLSLSRLMRSLPFWRVSHPSPLGPPLSWTPQRNTINRTQYFRKCRWHTPWHEHLHLIDIMGRFPRHGLNLVLIALIWSAVSESPLGILLMFKD